MAALGRLARAVAHDINNVFNTLSLTGELLETLEAEELRRYGTTIREAVGLGGRLVEQLSLFGEEAAEAGARVDLAFLIERMRPVLVEAMRGARLEIAVHSGATTVLAQASQIEQVVLNLCVNAVEAIAAPSQGLVRIELRDARPTNRSIRRRWCWPSQTTARGWTPRPRSTSSSPTSRASRAATASGCRWSTGS